jgi:hypothetical protein
MLLIRWMLGTITATVLTILGIAVRYLVFRGTPW